MFNHYFDDDGVYTLTTEAYPGTIAAPDCIRLKKDLSIPDGRWPVLNAARDGFDLVEDHRGKEGWVGAEKIKIAALGPLPEGWSDRPPRPDLNIDQKREMAYCAEADPLFREAQYYYAEARGLKAAGDYEGAAKYEAKADELERLYAAKKAEIRLRYPNPGEERYILADSGVYHMPGCGHSGAGGTASTLAEIAAVEGARACARCKPPATGEGAANG